MNAQEWQIVELNTTARCTLKPSPIHGIGVFAIKDIKKGDRAYCLPQRIERKWFSIPYGSFNKIDKELREIILGRWPNVTRGARFFAPNDEVWLPSFINHSDTPNYDLRTDSAVQDIKRGEEITENYREVRNYQEIYPWLK